jgi:hypothetical protein
MANKFASDLIYGLKIASTWETAVTVGASDGLYLSEGPGFYSSQREALPDRSSGFGGFTQMYYGKADEAFEMSGPMRWANAQFVHLFCLVGGETASQQDGTSAYLHTADFDDDIDGHFYTALQDDGTGGTTMSQIQSVKPTGMVIRSGADGFLEFTATGMKTQPLFGVHGDQATGASITYESARLRIPNKILRFRINTASGDALDSDDIVDIADYELSIQRPFERNDFAGGDTYSDSEFNTSEPLPTENYPEITFSFNMANINDYILFDDWYNYGDTIYKQYKFDLLWQGATIEHPYKYELQFEIPEAQAVDNDNNPSQNERWGYSHTLRAMVADSAPTGMTGITNYLKLSLQNERTSIYAKA